MAAEAWLGACIRCIWSVVTLNPAQQNPVPSNKPDWRFFSNNNKKYWQCLTVENNWRDAVVAVLAVLAVVAVIAVDCGKLR